MLPKLSMFASCLFLSLVFVDGGGGAAVVVVVVVAVVGLLRLIRTD